MKRKASKTKIPRRFAPSTGSAPHALDWGWREVGDDGIEVFGRIQVRERLLDTKALPRTGSREAAVKALAGKLRERMAQGMECDPKRIRFINAGRSENAPRYEPNQAHRLPLTATVEWKGTMGKSKTNERKSGAAVRVERIVSQIVTRLFRVSNGDGYTNGNRIAVKVGEWPNEKELGGWCKEAASREIREVLANAPAHRPAREQEQP